MSHTSESTTLEVADGGGWALLNSLGNQTIGFEKILAGQKEVKELENITNCTGPHQLSGRATIVGTFHQQQRQSGQSYHKTYLAQPRA
jgi:hypothetical protein